MHRDWKRHVWVVIVAAGAVAFGMVLAGSLHLTPAGLADKAAPAAAAAAVGTRGLALPSFADIADETLTSVVSITSTEIVQTQSGSPFGSQDPFEFFFGPRRGTPQQRKQIQGGSGFIISEDGEILTNNHVVSGAEKIQVKLRDREVLPAKVIGTDPGTDVALIKIDTKGKLHPLPLGDSDRTRVGDWVMAVGNPLNFEGTVTVGVISGKGRGGLSDDPNSAALENFLQTDAAINFGNSGGPLINTAGQVVGINTAMIQPAQNIGFAVAINTAKQILPQLKTKGKVVRGLLGIRIGPVDQDVMQAFHLPSMEGAFVQSVDAGEAAAKAGIQHGDAIVKVDDMPVKDPRDLIGYVSSKPPGQKVRITLLRDGKTREVTATLGERQAGAETETERTGTRGATRQKLGISVTNLTPDLRQRLNVGSGVSGVIVEDVQEVSPAADQGLAPGDIITEINGKKVSSVSDFREELDRVRKGDYIRLYVRRFAPQEISRYVVIRAE
ncbi:MAG TPA: Do family serine endopeptidase [Thermoanaerobaculia bacterium]|nr:Do family serine endopeptidase [Thermoanaerobaculia bacterium]